MEAVRIATTYRTPVILLSDGYLANGSEPWRIPELSSWPRSTPASPRAEPRVSTSRRTRREFWPYLRDPETLARPWAVPGTPGLEHRIGGIEKADGHGNISYDPANHDLMVRTARPRSTDRRVDPAARGRRPAGEAEVLVLGWGSTYGPIGGGVRRVRNAGYRRRPGPPAPPQPVPADLGEMLRATSRCWSPR